MTARQACEPLIEDATDARWAVWRPFIETSAALQTVLDDELRTTSNISLADYHVLLLLSQADRRRLRMNELARSMVFSTSRLSYQVDVLCRKGWVKRARATEDRRGSYAVLTDAGRAALTDAGHIHLQTVQRLFVDALDAGDAAALTGILTRLSERLEKS